MKHYYDIIFLSNTPSFYKVNLCNEIGKKRKLLLVLLGYGDEAVNSHLNDASELKFDFVFLNKGDMYKRNRFIVFVKLINLLRSIRYKKILYSGWMLTEFNIVSFFLPKDKNVVICESTIWESNMRGLKGWTKRCIISRMGTALPSGIPHKALFESIGYKGKIHITGSVGLINYGKRCKNTMSRDKFRYLYVGRLTSVKNLKFLINVFNENGKDLTIVGKGDQEEELKNMAHSNIHFIGFVDNEKLASIYEQHDIFILPSSYEPWGLVVEEALYWGLPVLVSDKVGCGPDLVQTYKSGLTFKSNDYNDLQESINRLELSYNNILINVNNIDWTARRLNQITTYEKIAY